MKEIIEKFIGYLRYERNASPETVDDYGGDVRLFEEFLTPPGGATRPLEEGDHRGIGEFGGAGEHAETSEAGAASADGGGDQQFSGWVAWWRGCQGFAGPQEQRKDQNA